MILVVDDALPEPQRVLEHAVTREFGTVEGPDGQSYTGISLDVPGWIAGPLYTRLNELLGPIEPTYLFFRVSPAGSRPPQWVHADSKLGDATAVVYLTPNPPPLSGTAIVRHVDGLETHPETLAEYDTWRRDHSDPAKWIVRDFVPMKFNRMVLLPGYPLHAACPMVGFGDGPWNARLVLVTFFKKLGD